MSRGDAEAAWGQTPPHSMSHCVGLEDGETCCSEAQKEEGDTVSGSRKHHDPVPGSPAPR